MTDHADTIRYANDLLREATNGNYAAGESDAALDALLAENQRLRDALEEILGMQSSDPLADAKDAAQEALAGDAE